MKNRLTVFLGCYSLIPMTAFAQQRMNIIYIMTDQQAATAMSCAGNNDLKLQQWTPSLKRSQIHQCLLCTSSERSVTFCHVYRLYAFRHRNAGKRNASA